MARNCGILLPTIFSPIDNMRSHTKVFAVLITPAVHPSIKSFTKTPNQ